jgi:hypothetical protein
LLFPVALNMNEVSERMSVTAVADLELLPQEERAMLLNRDVVRILGEEDGVGDAPKFGVEELFVWL